MKAIKLTEIVRTDGKPVKFKYLKKGFKQAKKLLYWSKGDNLKLLKLLKKASSIEQVYYFEKLNKIVIHKSSYFPSNLGDTYKSRLGNIIYLGEL